MGKRNNARSIALADGDEWHTFHSQAYLFVTMIQTIKVNIMSRTSTCLKTLMLCVLAHAGSAAAQQQPPSEAPPKLERIEPGSDVPATTVPERGRTKIIEKKQGGVVTEVEVQSGKSHYVMRPNRPAGNAQPGDAQSSQIRPPEWKVLEFDLTGKKRKSEAAVADEAAATADAPPPPPPRAGTK
jgi:hypothetical protein